ncbi:MULTISPECIES: FecCD family ABC transporter permease [Shewanella]|uniref:Iron ABC transporter permease n=1 Tax=Shewanella fidelis TaxID=173509 RepID=A0AAW8NKX8_9GAMM|nr:MULTISPECIES: iron ABC transporter permease [Shewanella]MDR8522558.1 iron ABC transporter permease [Shewanella fidelis]MDW4812908.1 iron ABC transporter permease [Shewanella fidelis]MDW4816833.1 iron ABC transporter permease [Shewanella fidelis]MDW4820915.1 iron ABC transporter permease [Shewanella fidelis]MDW4825550.1 iron ABC transporter permease [Shewanella fidelis]
MSTASKVFNPQRRLVEYLLYSLVVGLTILTPFAATSFGAATISVVDVFSVLSHKLFSIGESLGVRERIIWELRLPRVLLAFIAGAGLSIAGSVLQTVTRNPLADPYLFGISSGASFGAVVVLTLFSQSVLWLSLPVGAFIGASISVVMVLGLCGRNLSTQVERMLLSGVAISFMFGAMASLMLYFSSPQAAASVLFWTLGSFAKASWQGLWLPAAVVLIAMLIILLNKRQIVAMRAGDETAHTLGINVSHLRLNMLLLCSLITAILVANCGGIGFIGLMVPHTVRLLFPGRYPLLLTALIGGLFMVWVDVLARTLLSYQELPVGIITSVMGSIFFLFILASRSAKRI